MAQNISMTQIPPSGTIKFYSGIDIRPGRQRIFKTKAERKAYFDAHLVKSFNDVSYIRLGRGIQIESDTLSINQCNYISYKNKAVGGYEDEIFARIDPNWEYVNPSTVRINFSVDSWTTYMFDIEMKEGVVHKEHMSETDWTAAVANPYADIFQLQTSEDLPMDQSMERIATLDSGDVYVFPEIGNNGHDVPHSDMRLLIIIGQQDLTNLNPTELGPTWSSISSSITSRGGSVTSNSMVQGIPSPCTILIMTYENSTDQNNLKNLLDILEYNAVTGNIVGMYWIPREYAVMTTQFIRHSMTPTPSSYTPHNPKLFRSPYCYLRVSDESGQYKHYAWEEFQPLVSGSLNIVQLDIFFSKVGMPSLFVAPKQYKTIIGASTSDEALLTNFDEALVHDDIPYLPYSTDGYLSSLGAKMRETWSGNNPVKNLAAKSRYNSEDKTWFRDKVDELQNPKYKDGFLGAVDNISDMFVGNILGGIAKLQKGTRDIAQGVGVNLEKATVADNYNAGAVKGWAGYMRAPLRFIFQKVCPRADIVEQYDKYFDYFGYNSGRIGLPYVYNYIKQTGDQPHFATIDGEQVTYCQADISVTTNGKMPAVAANDIEAMFSAGVLFTK